MSGPYRRRVGTARPSHLMFTGGVGGIVELPNFSVLVHGLDEWNYARLVEGVPTINEPRLLAAVQQRLGVQVGQMRPPPWMVGESADPNNPANTVGVPVHPFPAWFRCTRCQRLDSLESGTFEFTNDVLSRPFEARFSHPNCARRSRAAVPARFLVTCRNAHLDEFPFSWFVHGGGPCPNNQYPALYMYDAGAEAAANVTIKCKVCGASKNMATAQGRRGQENLPGCRGRHPHLRRYEECDEQAQLLVVGASNQWFAETLQTLALPASSGSELDSMIDQLWDTLSVITLRDVLAYAYRQQFSDQLSKWTLDEVWEAVERRRATESGQVDAGDVTAQQIDLLGPEWELLTRTPPPPPMQDFTVRVPSEVPPYAGLAEVRQVERLRLARALIGFTRLDAPDPEEELEAIVRAPLAADPPSWVPASDVRGEGLFVRFDSEALAAWERRVARSPIVRQHRRAFAQFRANRASSRFARPSDYDWAMGWPGLRYYLVHSFAHVMLRSIALECGYSAASLAERIYARSDGDLAGFLIYTAVPDAEGTLGGLVSLGEPDRFERVLTRALSDAAACSSDPLCGETAPHQGSDACYAASCHVCMFISETSCERGNRFLDRRLLVDLGDPALAYWP